MMNESWNQYYVLVNSSTRKGLRNGYTDDGLPPLKPTPRRLKDSHKHSSQNVIYIEHSNLYKENSQNVFKQTHHLAGIAGTTRESIAVQSSRMNPSVQRGIQRSRRSALYNVSSSEEATEIKYKICIKLQNNYYNLKNLKWNFIN